MKALIASLAALGLIASPVVAQTTNTSTNTTAKAKPKPKAARTHKTAKASKPVAKEAKAEGESVATEAKEHAAATHHAKKHHATKMAKKTTTKTSTAKKTG